MSLRPLHVVDPAEKAVSKMKEFFPETIEQVRSAIARSDVVVVGMAQNPHVKNVRQALTAANISFEYLEYGSYF